MTFAIEHTALDAAAASELKVGDADARLELDAAGRKVARRVGICDPPPVGYTFDDEASVVAASCIARCLIIADRTQFDRSGEPRALIAVDDATDHVLRDLESELE